MKNSKGIALTLTGESNCEQPMVIFTPTEFADNIAVGAFVEIGMTGAINWYGFGL